MSEIASVETGKADAPVRVKIAPVTGRPSALTVHGVIDAMPSWVSRQIAKKEALAIAAEIRAAGAHSGVEVGVASGYSSAVIYAALSEGTTAPALYAIDWARKCYFHPEKTTGAAFHEIHVHDAAYSLHLGIHTGMVASMPELDFAFIDAKHQHPWPALDLLSLSRFLSPGAIVALHDYEMVFNPRHRDAGGARDMFRAWRGDKWRRTDAPNVGFLRYDENALVLSVSTALRTDWDISLSTYQARDFKIVAREIGEERLVAVIDECADTSRFSTLVG